MTNLKLETTSESRRAFLKTGGALVVIFAVGDGGAAAPAMPGKTVAGDQVDGFLAIDSKGRVTVFSGKVDLGTGIQTAMAQIAAEELSVPLDRITVIQGDTALTPDQGVTFGSLSIQNGGMQIRQAAATARDALVSQVARASPRRASRSRTAWWYRSPEARAGATGSSWAAAISS